MMKYMMNVLVFLNYRVSGSLVLTIRRGVERSQ